MKIISAKQIREADAYTISSEPIRSIELMERAATICVKWIVKNISAGKKIFVVCGTGNNGGDGLAIARLLSEEKFSVEVLVLSFPDASKDFLVNLEKLSLTRVPIRTIHQNDSLHLTRECIVVDAIFGTGLSREVSGWPGECIAEINAGGNTIISIDVPSGLFADLPASGRIVKAHHTLTFQSPKLSFLFPTSGNFVGEFHILDIGLDKKFIDGLPSKIFFVLDEDVSELLKKREKFSHKGDYGHSYLICGSRGKVGAAILAAKACLRSGTGLLTIQIPKCGYTAMQTAIPEAMVISDAEDFVSDFESYEENMTLGIGPGIGTKTETVKMLSKLLERQHKPLVLDADALNILSANPELLKNLPANSILTPHPKEFERLAGKSKDDFERHEKQLKFSKDYGIIILLKGAHTCITDPEGFSYFNSTGNPGMAKGGTGDVLTGILTALLAQKYQPLHAAIFGAFIHGRAGDFANMEFGVNTMTASDLIDKLHLAFNSIKQTKPISL